jgi:DNA-directed RNA polymerase subunit L
MSNIDIKIKEVSKQEFKNLQASQLSIELYGKTVSLALVNTLRRLAYDYVPTYAFPNELITIDKNVSIFDNDYMRLRLSEITIPKISNKVNYLTEKYWKNIDFANPEREKHPDDNKILELYINVINDTKDIMNVTTEYVRIFENGAEVQHKFDPKFPLLLIQLRSGESFSCQCVAALSIGKVNHIFSAAGNAYFDDRLEEKDTKYTKYTLTLESQGQISEYETLYKSCIVMKEKLGETKKLMKKQYDSPMVKESTTLQIELTNEDHTLGNIINDFLQDHTEVLFSGISKPSLLIDTMVITLATIKKNPLIPIIETIDYLVKVFDNIQSQIKKIGKL